MNFNNCYFYSEDNDMGAIVSTCDYPEKPEYGHCPCCKNYYTEVKDFICPKFIDKKDAKQIVKKHLLSTKNG